VRCGTRRHGHGCLHRDAERGARAALADAEIEYDAATSPHYRHGKRARAGAKACRKLADAGVNFDLRLPVRVSAESSSRHLAENLDAAADALGDQVVSD
jgi:hypothetical protein